jgi:predicted Zn-dependent peptidase
MRKPSWHWCAAFVTVWAAWAASVLAQNLEDRVVEHVLPNGMKVLALRRPQSPAVAVRMYVKVGAVDEPVGKTGIAHMIEHMLFKGTTEFGTTDYAAEKPILERLDALYRAFDEERDQGEAADRERLAQLEREIAQANDEAKQYVRSEELFRVYSYHGGEGLNAGTGMDFTLYEISLPSNKLELWMALESERMRDAVLREFYVERDIVREERRQRTEVQPEGMLWEQFLAAAFTAHPYGRPVVGWESDINRLKRDEAERFFRTYYAPNNAVVAIVGDVNPDNAIALMARYFADIPAQPIAERIRTREPEQRGERRVLVEFDAEPQVLIGFHKPTVPTFDDFVFDMIDGLLTNGRTSRLYRALVEQQQVAVSVGSSNGEPGARYPNLFVISAVPRHPHTAEEVEEALYAELERLKTEPIPDRELQKVRNQIEASFIRGLNSNEGMAEQLAYFETVAGSWRYVLDLLDTVRRISGDDVQRAAREYLTPSNRTVATLVRPPAASTNGTEGAVGEESDE